MWTGGFTKVRVRGILWQMRYFVLDNHPTNPLRYSHADQKTKFVTLPLQNVASIEVRSHRRPPLLPEHAFQKQTVKPTATHTHTQPLAHAPR